MTILLLATILLQSMTSACSDNAPGAMEEPTPVREVLTIAMNSFTGGQLTLNNLADGLYDLEFYAKGQGNGYVEANGKKTTVMASPQVQQKGYVRGIQVSGGTCSIAIHDEQVQNFSMMKLIKSEKPFVLLKGGDISELTYIEQKGGKYYDASGKQGDCLDILSVNGMNLVRLRLYNDPGNSNYAPSNRLPQGIQSPDDILSLARRAKAAGMQILLSFHYSDYWTNGETQTIPHDWDGMNAEQMTKALYDFTYGFMEKMKAQGTSPEFVSLGNETQAGMLCPLGGPLDSNNPEYTTLVKNLAGFYNAGYDAVKASNPDSRVIIHLAGAGDRDTNNWYFGLMNDWGVQYDIIGSSYYPFWTGNTVKEVCDWAEYVTKRYNRDLIFMETGYAWSQTIEDGVTNGQLTHNGPYTDMSKIGQKNFMNELMNEIKKVDNQRVLGFVYWDPIFIPAGDAGWELGAKNIVSNSALFGFSGEVLPVLDIFRNNN